MCVVCVYILKAIIYLLGVYVPNLKIYNVMRNSHHGILVNLCTYSMLQLEGVL